jgi:TonB family protein
MGEDWGARAALGADAVPFTADGAPEPIEGLLTKAEARALSRKLTEGRNDDIFVRARPRPKPRRDDQEGERYGTLSYAGGLPPGVLRDVLAIGGCTPEPHLRVIGLVHYADDGRPRRVALGSASAPAACPDVAGPILGLTLVPRKLIEEAGGEAASPGERRIALVVPLDESSIACAEAPDWSAPAQVPEEGTAVAARIKEPRKIQHAAPVYPARAREQRRQGTVIIEAVISSAGCIRSMRVIAGTEPDLNAAAMAAVAQWRYTPTLLRGKPVPVIMMVTVNFRLS